MVCEIEVDRDLQSGPSDRCQPLADVFSQGLTEFKSYLDTCANNPTEFEGTHLVKIMDSFGHDLHSHLKKEPEKLASLSKYPIDMKAISEKTARHSMNRTSAVHVLPILWFNLDTDFEDGKWKNFPEVPGPIKWVMINVLGWWRSNLWRFGSCGADGKAVPLLALRDSY